jgi:phage protein D
MPFYPQYAPDYIIKINGQNLPANIRNSIMSVKFDDAVRETDRVELQVFDSNMDLMEHPLFNIYNELSLSIGYAGKPLQEVFIGEITGRSASFSNGAVNLTVEASDFGHRLMAGTQETSFGSLPDPAIVLFLAIQHGLIPMTDAASAAVLSALAILLGKPKFQQGESDFEFLLKMAVSSGVHFRVEKRNLVFKVFQEFQPSMNLKFGQNLMDFSPRLSVVGQIEGVSVKIWLRELKLSFVITVGWDFGDKRLRISVLPGVAAAVGSGKPEFKFLDQPIKDPTDFAKVLVKAFSELKNRLNNRLTGSASVIGDPTIRAGMVVDVGGVGSEFSGNYRINSTSHSIDSSGYKTTLNINQEIIPEVFA